MTVHRPIFLTACRTLLLPLVVVNLAIVLSGCDKSMLSNNTAQNEVIIADTADVESTIAANDQTVSIAHMAKITDTSLTTASQNTVSLSGYQNLSFGQIITPELLVDQGLTKESHDNTQCYYVSNPKLTYIDKEYGERASVLYQIIDDKVALIVIQDPTTSFYIDINVGDSVDEVMTSHNNNLVYEVDKYDQSGNYYHLIHDITDKRATTNSTNQASTVNDLPLQIKYNIVGGKKIINTASDVDIELDKWTPSQLAQLQGNVETIEIGIPAAIRLTEGCS